MLDELELRMSVPADVAAIEDLYAETFPDEDLLPLVRDLLRDSDSALSLVGAIGSQLAGHAIFTRCGLADGSAKAALLGPLAVGPGWQRRGIGSALVRAGLRQLKDADVELIFVLGDPAYYGRFGFTPDRRVAPPFALPSEWSGAWQSRYLRDTSRPCAGKLTVPPPWRRRALWAP